MEEADVDMDKKTATGAMQAVFRALSETLKEGKRVQIKDFGTFERKYRAARKVGARLQTPSTARRQRKRNQRRNTTQRKRKTNDTLGRNPQTGEELDIAGRYSASFSPAKKMKDALNEDESKA
eukprot:scaffold48_cov311-Pinguiococcus_pyrenoidosus.AAC.14